MKFSALLRSPLVWAILGVAALMAVWRGQQRADRLTVYCSHDAAYAEAVLREFERRTGIPLAIRFDTEATKSLGLVELLIAEKDAPRCDVFWNGEPLGTAELAERGLLLPFLGAHRDRIPPAFRDPEARWIGFAGRLRVWIYHPTRLAPEQAAATISQRLRDGDLARFALAKPLYGTTLTHYAAWWQLWGPDALRRWHRETRARGLREVNGNAAVKDAVATGACDFGLTDTDDFFSARAAGAPVAALPVWLEDGTTLCLPNTAAIIRGTRRLDAAQKLVDFLSSADAELLLARSGARQIPLGPVPEGDLPAELRELRDWARHGRDLRDLRPARAACLAWLKEEALR